MTIDMSQFHGAFLEESAEHLDEIEHLLMALDPEQPDLEELNCIFRAAHSIKGGSGIFGFDSLISVTHVMENIFDRARQGTYQFSRPIIDVLLKAVDALRQLLANYGDSVEPDWVLVNLTTEQLEALLDPARVALLTDDHGFGFFVPLPTKSQSDDGFGFFTPVELIDDDGFGFFEPIESSEKLLAVEQTAAKQDANILEAENTNSTLSTQVSSFKPPAKLHNAVEADSQLPNKKDQPKTKAENLEASTIRVDIQKVDSLVNLVGELVITQSMLTLLTEDMTGIDVERLQVAMRELERNTRDIQEGIMSIRMLPMSFVFNRFPRVVRDLSTKLHKQVELKIEGGHTEIDKGLIEKLVDPLTHLVRNSLDHGIESPQARQALEKPASGTITLKAEQKGGNIIISVIDDGAGLNRQKIIAKAHERGIFVSEQAQDHEVWDLIMAPGFSTADQITDVSGRGVGMDVVKRNIESMGGKIEISSAAGAGSTFQIRLPLTLAILDGMSVAVGDQLYIIPLVNIIESMQPVKEQLKLIANQQMLELRNTYWPILRLYELMDVEPKQQAADNAILVLIETSKNRFALMVDDLVGQQQVVIKSLEQHYRRVPGVAGATIMGDGSVALILDAESLTLPSA
jgi:two-component system chemotaxis sensor kinase CheA